MTVENTRVPNAHHLHLSLRTVRCICWQYDISFWIQWLRISTHWWRFAVSLLTISVSF